MVEALDVVEHVGSGISHGQVPASVDALPLKYAEEALGWSIVAAMADVTHAQCDVVVL